MPPSFVQSRSINDKKPDPVNTLLTIYLLDEQPILKSQSVCILGSNDGIIPAYLAKHLPSCQVWAIGMTVNSIHLINQIRETNRLPNIYTFPELADPSSYLRVSHENESFDAAIILLPKGRKVVRHWLLQAYQFLKDGGIVYLVGANDAGVKAVAKDTAELFSSINVLGYKHGTRLYRAVKQYPYKPMPSWTYEPGIAIGTWNEYNVEIRNQVFSLRTLPGVFSFDHLDAGTQLLLECVMIENNRSVLDIGCGCGIIGMFAARLGAKVVHLADNHLLSVATATENIKLNNISNAFVYLSDLYVNLPATSYDMIFSNPPFHSGKEVDYQVTQRIVAGGYQRLAKGGSMIIVANRFIRYQSLLDQIFGNVCIINETSKFHVLSSQKT